MQHHNFDVDIFIPSSQQKVKITKDIVQVNQNSIACVDIVAVRYGVSLIGKVKKPIKKTYVIAVKSKNGQTLEINFESSKVAELLAEDHTYYYIMTGLWHAVKKELVNTFIDQLNNKQTITIGKTAINFEGCMLHYKTWFLGKTKTVLVPWSELAYHQDKGLLHIKEANDPKKKVSLSFHYDWNAVVLNTLLHFLWQEKRKEQLQKGEIITI
jgi:hypothetical protein